jgi:hypothetical protein
MGYFDALTASYFKTTPDGRRLFYPWGVFGRGYTIPSEQQYERLRGRIKTYTIAALVLIIGAAVLLKSLWAFAVAGLLIVFYRAWTPFLLRDLQPSDEKLSLTESMTAQARAQSGSILWLLLILSLLFVATGIAMLVFDPDRWLTAVSGTVFFGLCAAVFVRMLVLQRRARAPQA